MKSKSLLYAHLALIGVAFLYGANYTIAKIVLNDNHIPPLGFIVIRVAFGALLFSLFHALFVKEKVQKEDWGRLFLCACFGVAINMMFFFKGLQLTGAINSSLIMTTTPILVLIVSAILIKEQITTRKIVGILLGCIGAILLIMHGRQFAQNNPIGDLMILVNALSFGVYLVLVKSLMAKYNPFTVVKWVFLIGFCLVLPFGWQDLQGVAWSSFTIDIWLAVAYVILGATFGTYLLNTFALKTVNPSTVSIYIYLQPLVASMIALAVGGDSLTSTKVLAALLIFIGVFLVSKKVKSS